MKVWVTSLGKEPRAANVLAEGKENMDWAVKEGSYKHQLQTCDQLQKWGL